MNIKKIILSLVFVNLFLPVKISASENRQIYKPDEAILYSSSGIPDQNSWDSYQEKRIQENKKKSQIQTLGFNPASCVSFVKYKTGFNQSIGVARNWPLNAKFGSVGGVIVLNESKAGHVALITGISEFGYVVTEANYISGKVTSGRIIPYDDLSIIGFWVST